MNSLHIYKFGVINYISTVVKFDCPINDKCVTCITSIYTYMNDKPAASVKRISKQLDAFASVVDF